MFFFGGDIGSGSSHERFFDSLSQFNLKLCLGNHDDFAELQSRVSYLLPTGHNELFYSFEDEYFKHIVLDSSTARISLAQFEWFCNELKTNKTILLFVHHPVLEIKTAADREFPLSGRAEIRNELVNTGNRSLHILRSLSYGRREDDWQHYSGDYSGKFVLY